MKEKILYVCMFILLFNISSCSSESNKKITIRSCNIKLANSLLFSLKNDIELLKYCHENLSENKELIIKIEESLFIELSVISSIAPAFDELGGTPLIVLVSILNYQHDNLFYYSGPGKNEIVDDYLTYIANSLIEQKDKYDKLPITPLMKFYKRQGQ